MNNSPADISMSFVEPERCGCELTKTDERKAVDEALRKDRREFIPSIIMIKIRRLKEISRGNLIDEKMPRD